MAESPSGGTVAWHYGNIDESDFIGAEEYLPTLSNTVRFMAYIFFCVICILSIFFCFGLCILSIYI